MARPFKQGLDYFPMDVGFFEDDKIKFIGALYGSTGQAIAVRLLCKIYRDTGYYLKWDDDVALLFAQDCGRNVEWHDVNNVVRELVRRGFFSEDQFHSRAVLTSAAIQRRYAKICTDSKRKNWSILPEYSLIDPVQTGLTPEETPENSGVSTQSKVKESKVEEKEVVAAAPPSRPLHVAIKDRKQTFVALIQKHSAGYDRAMLNEFYSYWTEMNEGGKKMRYEMQRVFDVKRRLKTWHQKDLETKKRSAAPGTAQVQVLAPEQNMKPL